MALRDYIGLLVRVAALALFMLVSSYGQEPHKKWERAWVGSIAVLGTSAALDLHSSRGGQEANPFLRRADGSANLAKGAIVKGALIGSLFLIGKVWPGRKPYKALTFINLGSSAAWTGAAVRNYSIRE